MVELTVSVPDEVAERLAPLKDHLADLLQQVAKSLPEGASGKVAVATQSRMEDDILNFLAQGPSAQQIVEFQVSPAVQDRLAALLDKNDEGALTAVEALELDQFERWNQMFAHLKLRAYKIIHS